MTSSLLIKQDEDTAKHPESGSRQNTHASGYNQLFITQHYTATFLLNVIGTQS